MHTHTHWVVLCVTFMCQAKAASMHFIWLGSYEIIPPVSCAVANALNFRQRNSVSLFLHFNTSGLWLHNKRFVVDRSI